VGLEPHNPDPGFLCGPSRHTLRFRVLNTQPKILKTQEIVKNFAEDAENVGAHENIKQRVLVF